MQKCTCIYNYVDFNKQKWLVDSHKVQKWVFLLFILQVGLRVVNSSVWEGEVEEMVLGGGIKLGVLQ